jgi:8-oxo-dGTP diphosphatase
MYIYTLAFIKNKDEILLINRNKKPWKGAWNGVGGKVQNDETPLDCIVREIEEETTLVIHPSQVQDKGILTWSNFEAIGLGLHIFLVEIEGEIPFQTPVKTAEGILDWKPISWINDLENEGIAKNIPYFLPVILNSPDRFHFHCVFEDRILKSVSTELIQS